MADTKSCDCCGAAGATKVTVGLAFEGLAHPDKTTGTAYETDACPNHRVFAAGVLHRRAIEKLREQGPFHAQLEANDAEAAAAKRAQQEARIAELGAARATLLRDATVRSDARDAAMRQELKPPK